MNKSLLPLLSLCTVASMLAGQGVPSTATPAVIVSTAAEPVAAGKFGPNFRVERLAAPTHPECPARGA